MSRPGEHLIGGRPASAGRVGRLQPDQVRGGRLLRGTAPGGHRPPPAGVAGRTRRGRHRAGHPPAPRDPGPVGPALRRHGTSGGVRHRRHRSSSSSPAPVTWPSTRSWCAPPTRPTEHRSRGGDRRPGGRAAQPVYRSHERPGRASSRLHPRPRRGLPGGWRRRRRGQQRGAGPRDGGQLADLARRHAGAGPAPPGGGRSTCPGTVTRRPRRGTTRWGRWPASSAT